MTSAKAFGKIIVLGEHAVVYGEPALAGALSAGCVVDVEKSEHGVPHLMLDTQVFKVSDADNGVCKAVRIAQEAAGIAASALDVTIQKQILALLADLQHKYNMAYLLISHDLEVVEAMSHRIITLKKGKQIKHQEL